METNNTARKTVSSVSEIKVGDTIHWMNGLHMPESAVVFKDARFGNSLRVKLFFNDCSVQYLLNIHGSLEVTAQ